MYCTVKALTLLLESYKQRNQGLTVKKEIKTLESRQIYRNRWMSLKEDRILRANGSEGLYSVIEKDDFVVIIPVENDEIYLVEQYRYPLGQRTTELPQGSWECSRDAAPEDVARGELKEETGLSRLSKARTGLFSPGLSYLPCHGADIYRPATGGGRIRPDGEKN